ncbi:MAG TPA: hypothetical protein PL110_06475 [Candidatus Eremiobacteraeota bacterium]|nr:hypothetical protein [Candidatus Eremiobacteraeota bacterium]
MKYVIAPVLNRLVNKVLFFGLQAGILTGAKLEKKYSEDFVRKNLEEVIMLLVGEMQEDFIQYTKEEIDFIMKNSCVEVPVMGTVYAE